MVNISGNKSTIPKIVGAEENTALKTGRSQQKPAITGFTPVSVETAQHSAPSTPVIQSNVQQATQTTKPSLPQTAAAPAWEQNQRKLNNRGITQTTMDFGDWNQTPVLWDHSQFIPAKQKIEPVAQTFADVHKLAPHDDDSAGRGSRGDGSGTRGGGFDGSRGGFGGRGRVGSFGGSATSYQNYLTAPDFSYYSNLGANIENPSYTEAEGYANIFGWRPGAKPVENIVTFSRDNAHMIMLNELNANSVVGDIRYYYMTDDEVGIYNYLLAKEGEESAQEYLDFLDEELNKRNGTAYGEAIRNTEDPVVRALLTGATAVVSGLDHVKHGVQQLFFEEQVPDSSIQFSSEYIRDDMLQDGNKIGVSVYDTVETLSSMAPSILASCLLGPGWGAALQGASSSGNAYNQALEDGYSKEQARTYATLVGVSEGALQYAVGGISKLGGVSSEQLLTKLVGIENGLLRSAAALGIKGLSEVTEEELQLVLEPLYRTIVFGEAYDAPTVEEYVYTAVITFVTTGVVEAGDIANYARNRPVQSVEWDFADAAIDLEGNMGYDGTKSGNYLDDIKALDDFLTKPQKLADSTEYELYDYLLNHGYEVHPLSRGSFKGIPFEEGGGFKVNWGGDRILQYHPASSSHHGGAYFKISSGDTGIIRIDMNGNIIVKENGR